MILVTRKQQTLDLLQSFRVVPLYQMGMSTDYSLQACFAGFVTKIHLRGL